MAHCPNPTGDRGPVAVARVVLDAFGLVPGDLLGAGGEAHVYALGADRVLRVLHPGGRAEDLRRRRDLVDQLRRSAPAFALPELLEVGEVDGRAYAVERRLPGTSVLDALRRAPGGERPRLVESALEVVAALGDLALGGFAPGPGYGDLLRPDAIGTGTWRAYLAARAAASLARSTPDLRGLDADALADALPEAEAPCFVHLDAYAGNMLAAGARVTAVLDVGATCVAGDRRLDPVSFAVYLAAPEITRSARREDVDVAGRWLRAAGLGDLLDPAQRWLAAYWSAAVDDAAVLAWCRRVLLHRGA